MSRVFGKEYKISCQGSGSRKRGQGYRSVRGRKDGSIKDPFVVRPVSPELDAEAIRVTRMMPKWKPGKQRNVNVAVRYTIPVTFKLSPKEKKAESVSIHGDSNGNLSVNLEKEKKPMVVVDGKPFDIDKLDQIDKSKIESIEVDKCVGKSEYIAKYGDKAKNGIIIVKLKE